MKKIYLFLLLVVTFTTTSCDGFLVQEPTTSLDQMSAYESVASADAVLNGCYATLGEYDYFGYRYMHVLSITSGAWTSTRSNEIPTTSMQIQVNDVHVEKMYAAYYASIGVANDILKNLPLSTIDKANKDRIMGEAYFIRAMTYFNLVRQFGKVPLVVKPVESYSEAHIGRTDTALVYQQIIDDLDSAFVRLPAPGSNAAGRPNKYAAPALQAKVHVTIAGNDPLSPNWKKAYDAATTVYTSTTYRLLRPFTAVFDIANKNSAESIFEIQFGASIMSLKLTNVTLPLRNTLTPSSTGGTQWGKTRPNKEVFDMFVNTYPGDPRIDGSFLHTSYTKMDLADKSKTLQVNIYPNTSNTTANGSLKANGDDKEYPFIKKFVDPAITTEASSCNFIYYRYADLLLILAEAANEIDKTDEAIGYVNELLARARDKNGDFVEDATELSPAAWPTGLSKDEVRTKIMTERQIELCGESDEWYTFRRRGADYLKTIVDRHNAHPHVNKPTPAKYVYKYVATDIDIKRNLKFPFPPAEITRNESIADTDQNFGY
jgi:hypothetical protein